MKTPIQVTHNSCNEKPNVQSIKTRPQEKNKIWFQVSRLFTLKRFNFQSFHFIKVNNKSKESHETFLFVKLKLLERLLHHVNRILFEISCIPSI